MSRFSSKLFAVLALFFEKSPYEAIFSYFFSQSFTKRKSQDTLVLGLSTGSGNCWTPGAALWVTRANRKTSPRSL